ncbi:MAG: NUDIX domain-containing protein [Bacteroidota bacterium]
MHKDIAKVYGNKVRLRACGLCWNDGSLLMVNHKLITPTNFWAPPGGGIEFGMLAEETLKKEFREETGLIVAPGKFLFGCEFIQDPLHSVELFFEVRVLSGKLITGSDPELPIIKDVKFMNSDEIQGLPPHELHGIFQVVQELDELKTLSGFYRI